MFSKKIPFYTVILSTLVGGLFSYFIFINWYTPEAKAQQHPDHPLLNTSCTYSITRMGGYQHVKPLLFAAQTCEAEKFAPLKGQMEGIIEQYKVAGVLSSASIYLRDLNQDEWMAINDQEKCMSGSLMKVPLLIALLHMDEMKPGTLNKEVLFEKPFTTDKHPVFLSEGIKLGHKYTIRQLLHYSIAYSDNEAASLLSAQLDPVFLQKVFSDLGLPHVDVTKSNYDFTAKNISVLLEVLYNTAYLTIPNSEYAMSLLTECNFKQGLVSGLPGDVTVAHKFGEAGDGRVFELHESGIVYLKNTPYLLTVMTKGPDIQKLPEVIGNISKLAYEDMSKLTL